MACTRGCSGDCTGTAGNGTSYAPGNTVCNSGGTASQSCGCGDGGCGGGCARSATGNWQTSIDTASGNCWCGRNCAGCGGCSGTCGGSCTGECAGCSGGCASGCIGTCTNGCSETCTGDCKTGCKGTCKDSCLGSCDEACTNTCGHLCNVTCQSDVAIEAYEYLEHYEKEPNLEITFTEHLKNDEGILEWLDAKDMQYLLDIIQEEGRRRIVKKTPKFSGTEEKKYEDKTEEDPLTYKEKRNIGLINELNKLITIRVGDLVDDSNSIKKINEILVNNTGKHISLSVGAGDISDGQKIKKSVGKQLIEKALEAYGETIGINTTSSKAGEETS